MNWALALPRAFRYSLNYGWQIIVHPDGSTEARGPDGQILRSHAPPTLRAG
jgi:hypothetical protein